MYKDKSDNDMNELEKYFNDGCDVTVYQDIDICVPITVEPYAKLHEAEVECIDEPYIVTNPNWAKGKNGTCRFNLAQKLCIMIPIEFKAKATSGPTSVICGDISDEGCPTDCHCHEGREDNRHNKSPFDFYIKGKRIEE